MQPLTLALAQTGLIQFGQFAQPDGAIWPVAVRLRWLPSYPALLRDLASALVPLFEQTKADRLLTTTDATPIGIALGLETGLPVVYPYGEVRDYTAAYAIEGAYDVGHATVLLTDVLSDAAQALQITTLARRVGLDVESIIAVIDLEHGARKQLLAAGYHVQSLLGLRAMLPVLETAGRLPSVMRMTVERWRKERDNAP